mgnify:CR=1 FL=1
MKTPRAIIDLARVGLVWTGAQHESMKRPAPAAVIARTRAPMGPIQWEQQLDWSGRYRWRVVS